MTATKYCVEVRDSSDRVITRWIVDVSEPETMGELWDRMPEILTALKEAKEVDAFAYCSRSTIIPSEADAHA